MQECTTHIFITFLSSIHLFWGGKNDVVQLTLSFFIQGHASDTLIISQESSFLFIKSVTTIICHWGNKEPVASLRRRLHLGVRVKAQRVLEHKGPHVTVWDNRCKYSSWCQESKYKHVSFIQNYHYLTFLKTNKAFGPAAI